MRGLPLAITGLRATLPHVVLGDGGEGHTTPTHRFCTKATVRCYSAVGLLYLSHGLRWSLLSLATPLRLRWCWPLVRRGLRWDRRHSPTRHNNDLAGWFSDLYHYSSPPSSVMVADPSPPLKNLANAARTAASMAALAVLAMFFRCQ
jgi:hypothetical protein